MTSLKHNSKLVLFLLISTLLFQITAYKFIWGIEFISRTINLIIILIFSLYFIQALMSVKFDKRVYALYFMPGMLVFLGYFINITINAIDNFNVANQYGLLIPWVVYLAIPGLLKTKKIDSYRLWGCFNHFMFLVAILSIIEYYALTYEIYSPHLIMTSGGEFLAGYFSMLYGLEDGNIHYRLYASFMEPGTLAMYLLPVIAYSFLYRKYISLSVYLYAMYMADSLGGFISLIMLSVMLVYTRFNTKRLTSLVVILFASVFLVAIFSETIMDRYEKKNVSAKIREDNVVEMIELLPDLITNHPLGLPLFESTHEAQESTIYFGANFVLGKAFNLGGVLSLTGYVLVLALSLWYAGYILLRRRSLVEEKLVAVSIVCLLPFIFQRTVVWDSNIFPLLFSPFIIHWLSNRSKMI